MMVMIDLRSSLEKQDFDSAYIVNSRDRAKPFSIEGWSLRRGYYWCSFKLVLLFYWMIYYYSQT